MASKQFRFRSKKNSFRDGSKNLCKKKGTKYVLASLGKGLDGVKDFHSEEDGTKEGRERKG